MKLIVDLKLLPTDDQSAALRDTLERANASANRLSALAWDHRTFRQFDLHKLAYRTVKDESGLSAQVVVRLIAKVADAYKLDRTRQRFFRPLGSIAYDDRILRYKADAVSIWTIGGRETVPFVCGERQRTLLASRQGESDLVYRDGAWFLLATVNVEEPPEGPVTDFLGVDMGVINLAVDSDGTRYSGATINNLRRRNRRLRQKLQRKGTQSARRLLRRRRRKESRFARDVNHRMSKRIVAVAECTGRGIAVEDLGGIRGRIKARKPQRATLHSWAFDQLRFFLTYKAKLAGVSVVLVDPCNTSRTCPSCGTIDKRNRPDQSHFRCVSCGFVGLPDSIAAENIRRAAVMRPHVPTGRPLPAQGQAPPL